MAPALARGGWALSDENFAKVRDEIVRLVGTPDQFQAVAYEMLQDSMPHLGLTPMKAEGQRSDWWRCLWTLA